MPRIKVSSVVAILAMLTWPLGATLAAPRTEPNLYRVKKIFLETQTNEDLSDLGMTAFHRLHPALKQALSTYGFIVVDDRADADAIMYGGNTSEWVVVDGPQLDPPKHGFQFWLASSKYGFEWLTEFDLSTRAVEPELGRKRRLAICSTLGNNLRHVLALLSVTVAVIFVSDAQQFVGRERRERLSHLVWCGGGCFDSRRRVNSTVRLMPDQGVGDDT